VSIDKTPSPAEAASIGSSTAVSLSGRKAVLPRPGQAWQRMAVCVARLCVQAQPQIKESHVDAKRSIHAIDPKLVAARRRLLPDGHLQR
jgi:hypothetical protein